LSSTNGYATVRDIKIHQREKEHCMKTPKRKELGKYIVADPEICHGQLTFKGTRSRVKSILFYVSQDKDWD
jgi:hypothetical protein